jgi:hypothetical protein
MRAPQRLVEWFSQAVFIDRRGLLPPGTTLQYHSRSDEHSKKLGEFIVDDLLDICPALVDHAARGVVAFGINIRHRWPNGKVKTLDLAFGVPQQLQPPAGARIRRLTGRSAETFTRLLIACEEKATMTEHGKSQPRIYAELNDAHTIVHQGDPDTIAAGITMLNIASTFVSPLRQRPDQPLVISHHRQPDVTANMVQHLRHLPRRTSPDSVGLDAYCTFVVNLDNQGNVSLHEGPPAPQPGDPDHYETFLQDIADAYTVRFSNLPAIAPQAIAIEHDLIALAHRYPGLLRRAAEVVEREDVPGTEELGRLLRSTESQAGNSVLS